MASEKVTVMILNVVDLKCPCCYKKVKKVLCKFPQIRDQAFDEDKNKVKIRVVCCDPEKMRDKLCCKGGKVIQSIEIIENKPKTSEKSKAVEKPKVDPPKPESPKVDPPKPDSPKQHEPASAPMSPVVVPRPFCPREYPVSACCQECYEGRPGGPCHYGYGRPVPPPPGPACCQECYQGRPGGPCHYGFGRPVPPGPCYDGYGYQYGGNRPCFVSRCDSFSEENPQACSIM